MIINYRVTHYSPGCPARIRYDENDHPAEPAEYEFEVTSIEFDCGFNQPSAPPDDAPWPLLPDEEAGLRLWFEANHDRACEEADYQSAGLLDCDY